VWSHPSLCTFTSSIAALSILPHDIRSILTQKGDDQVPKHRRYGREGGKEDGREGPEHAR